MSQDLKVFFYLAMEDDENATVAKTVVECPGPSRGASEFELHRIPVVELTDRSDREEDVWGGHGYLMPHYYRHDDDPEHVLELDPSTGKFVPQSSLRQWDEDTADFGVPLQRDDFSLPGEKSIAGHRPVNEEGPTRFCYVPASIADGLAGQWKTMGEEYWEEDEYEALHGQTSWHIADRLRPEVREAVGAFNLSSVVDLAPSMRSHDDSQTHNLSRGPRRHRGRAQAGKDKAYRIKSKANYRRRNDAQS
ncbi:hypothetical protein V8F33_010670 [Rhypophila sp. PSN 637]